MDTREQYHRRSILLDFIPKNLNLYGFFVFFIMNLYYTVLIIFKVCNVQAEEHKMVSDQFYLNIRAPALTVREGIKVILTCPKSNGTVTYITFVYSHILGERYITLVDSSKVNDISNKYSFNETNENTYAFTINSISRDDEGSYSCIQGPVSRALTITVIYRPSESNPQCSSNYKSPIIFYDEITDDFVFNCSTERGKPPATTKVYVNEQDVTSDLEIINETRTDKDNIFTTYSLFRHFNDTLQNSEFVCNVTQQLPSPYDDKYQGSCSFGPLHLLTGFSLSVSPSNVPVRDEDNVTLTCTSNVTGVKIEWNNIPSENYTVNTNYSRSSVLTVLSFKPASYGTVFVECSGSYGSRTVTANTTVFLMVNAEGHEDDDNYKKSVTFLPLLVACIVSSIILVTVLVALFICQNKRKSKRNPTNTPPGNNGLEKPSTSNHCEGHTLTTTELNMNNANNTAICGEDGVMCDNVCYESTSCGNFINSAKTTNAKVVDNGNPSYEVGNYVLDDDHIMCENVIYQSVSYANKKGTNTAGIAF